MFIVSRKLKICIGVAIGLAIAALAFVIWDVRTPQIVIWEKSTLGGVGVLRAPELVIQHQEANTSWATIGYAIYRSDQGGNFEKVFTVLPKVGLTWGGFSRILRSWSGQIELMEVVPLSPGRLVVFAGGDIFRVNVKTGRQDHVHTLRYFGLGEGRGVMPHGIALDESGSIYFGEYVTRPDYKDRTIRLYRSDDEAQSWEVAFEFGPGEVRHIHAVLWDAIGRALWVGTGDQNPEPRIGYSRDSGESFRWVGAGSQLFRVVSLLFFDDVVAWATDTTEQESMRTVVWHRNQDRFDYGETILPSPAYYALKLSDSDGLITLGEAETSVWLINSRNEVRKLFGWPVGAARRGPNPVVRLPRVSGSVSEWVYLSPVRTGKHDSAVFRIPVSDLLNWDNHSVN